MGLLDLLFPKHCVVCKHFGEYLCTDCFAKVSFDVGRICLVCNNPAIDGITHPVCQSKYSIDGAMASVTYKGVIKKLVYQFKYQPYLTDLQFLLTDLLYEGLIQQELLHKVLQSECVLVPIPLHPDRLRQRGYNHAQILSRNLGKRINLNTIPLLKRQKKTLTQAELNKEERAGNIKNAFVSDEKHLKLLAGKHVLLVDDIITSGATMKEAAKVLKKNGIEKVWGIALAHG